VLQTLFPHGKCCNKIPQEKFSIKIPCTVSSKAIKNFMFDVISFIFDVIDFIFNAINC